MATSDELRQYAAELLLEPRVELTDVFDMAEEYLGEAIGDTDAKTVDGLLSSAVITVTWPDSDLEWSNQDDTDEDGG